MNRNLSLASYQNNVSFNRLAPFARRFDFKARIWVHLLAVAAFLLGGMALAPQMAAAANITWGNPVNISGDTDVVTNGTLLYAYCNGTAVQTINGVTFTPGNNAIWGNVGFAGGTLSSATNVFGYTSGSFAGLSTAYSNILSGGTWVVGGGANTVTLANLTAGHSYEVQFWVNDSRNNATTETRVETLSGTGGGTLAFNAAQSPGGVGQYELGIFQATNATQSFIITGSGGGGSPVSQCNAISVRDLGVSTKTWVGASSTFWGAFGNWNPNAVPVTGDSVLFNNSSTANLATLLDASYSLVTLTLSNTAAPISIGPSSGNTLTIKGGINLVGSGQSLTINDSLVLGASQTWNVTNNSVCAVNGGVSGSAALTITGNGNVSFGSSATYTGNTTISGGSLTVANGGSIASANINIAAGSTFALSGSGTISVTPKITLAGGARFDVSAAAGYTLAGGTLVNSSAGVVISGSSDCSAGTLSVSYDGVNPPFIQTNGTLTLSSGTVVDINNAGAVLGAGNHIIIAATGTGTVAGTSPSSVNITGNGAVAPASLAIDGKGNLVLVVDSPDVWTGAADNNWGNGGNWMSANEPNAGDAILFNDLTTANLSISQNDPSGGAVLGVSILNPTGPVTIGGPNSLQTYAGGFNLSAASQNLTITAPLVLNATQNWIVTNSRTLTISGPVSTISGGNVTITGGGKVQMGATAVLDGLTNSPATGDFTVNGTLDLNGYSQVMNGVSVSSGGIVDNTAAGAAVLTVGGNGDNCSFNGIIQNTGSGALTLEVAQGNAQFLSTNTYSGGTIFNSGATLGASTSYSLGSGPVTFNPGAKSYTTGCTFTNAVFLNNASLRVGGGNNNIQTWSGPVTVTNGFQMSGDAGSRGVTLTGPMNFLGTGGIAITNSGGNGTPGTWQNYGGDYLSGAISGSGDITYYLNGSNSRLWLQGTNTYGGNTVVNGTSNGKLNVYGAVTPFGAGTVTLNAGAVIEAYPSSVTVTNALTLNGGTLEGESFGNSYNRLTWAGPITLTANSSLFQYGENNAQMSQGVNVAGSLNINGFTLTNSGTSGLYSGSTITGPISGAGTILETVNILYLYGTNTFTGTFRAVGGTLSVGNTYALQNATLDMNSADAGTVNFNNNDTVLGALTGSRNLALGSGVVSIGNNNASTTFGGVLTNSGSLIKIGTGTLTLLSNAYSGNTTVSGGTLSLAQPTLASSSTVTVAGGAVLNLNFATPTTNVVAGLVLNGVNKPSGIYNSANTSGYITGNGSLQVVNNTFVWTGAGGTSWIMPGDWLTGVIPSGTNTVLFNNLSTANLATVLNANFNIQSLVVSNPAGPVSIGGANTLALTNGINMANANQSLTITAPVVVGAAQTWTNSGAGILTVSNLSGSATLTLAGTGTVVLNGTNSTTGNNIILGGSTVKFAGPGSSSFPPSGTVYVLNNAGLNGVGTIDLNNATQSATAYLSFPYSTTTTLTNGTLIDNAAWTTATDTREDYNFMGTINLATNANYISNKRFVIGYHWNNFTTTINSLNNSTNGSLTWGGDSAGNQNYVSVAGETSFLRINGGTVNFTNNTTGTGNGYLNVGANNANSSGTIAISNANMNVGTTLKLCGNYNSTAGINCTGIVSVAYGVVTVGGGSDVSNNGVLFMNGGNGDNTAAASAGVSILSLTNATFMVAQIQAGNMGTKTINLNGGTLVARPGATNNFLSAATALTVNVQNGGATINSGTNSITVAAALVANGIGGLTKTGAGTLTLSGANTYSGGTTVNAGTLLINSTGGTGTNAVVINAGATLGGTGSIAGTVTNTAGGRLAAGTNGIGVLTIGGNLILNAGSTNTFVVNGSAPTNNSIVLGSAVTYGGVLNIVTNGTFAIGQKFTLFTGPGATNAGSFASIAGSPGTGKVFSFTNGVLSVVTGIASNPTNITATVNGGVLTLTWPQDHLGWLVQSNSVDLAVPADWHDISSTAAATTYSIPMSLTQTNVFYRLRHP